jgi:hypothetical protein
MEQGQDRRTEDAVQTQGHMGTPSLSSDGEPEARTCSVQPGYRQQASLCDLVGLKVRDICHGDQVAALK